MTVRRIRVALVRTYTEIQRNHTLQVAAALSYYSILSLFPALIFLSAALAFLPLPKVFNEVIPFMRHFFPEDAVSLFRGILSDVVFSKRTAFLSFGMLGTILAASGAFSAAIEAFDTAYEVEECRPFWKTRALAVALTFFIGLLFLLALSVMLVGPRFGEWLAARMHLSGLFVFLWPYLHWTIAISSTILAVETLYFLGPNVKQRFAATLPGAVFAVGSWIGLSYLLGVYFRHLASLNRTYGTLGGAIAIMTWLYWSAFTVLVGAEFNAELAKSSDKGPLPLKQEAKAPSGAASVARNNVA